MPLPSTKLLPSTTLLLGGAPVTPPPAPRVAPTLDPEAARLYQQIIPVAGEDQDHGYAAAHLCAVLMAPIERVARIALDDGDRPGYSRLLNVDDADAVDLPWLGQFNGTALTGEEAEGEARRRIREARGAHRGKVNALVSDLKATLGGTQFVQVLEGEGSPFSNTFVVLEAELLNEAASIAAITNRATKPLAAVNTLIATNSPLINQFTREINLITAEINALKLADVT